MDRKKTLDLLKKNENKETNYGESTKNIFLYKPFADNDVLTACCTEKTCFMLLRNGILLSWGEPCCTLGRIKDESSQESSYNPFPVKFFNSPTKIVDIACGFNHCLARGINYKVFSWGSNSHGQVTLCIYIKLGLNDFPQSQTSEKEELNEIQYFNEYVIIMK